jgi:TPR repeat protein
VTTSFHRIVVAWIVGFFACLGAISPAQALRMSVDGDKIIMEGPVEDSEVFRFSALLDEYKDQIKTVVFRKSPGGDADTSYRVASIIRQRGLGTAATGNCASGCAIMFMGGVRRQLTDENTRGTYIGFHGVYDPRGNARLGSRPFLKQAMMSYADGKADSELVDRWIALPREGLIYFFDPNRMRRQSDGVSTFLCPAAPKGAFENCEGIQKTAYDLGILTSRDLIKLAPESPSDDLFSSLDPEMVKELEEATAAMEKKDVATVLRVVRSWADKGIPQAQNLMGRMHQQGRGLAKDEAEAAVWYRKAAENGYVEAQNSLGRLLRNGTGVPKDVAEAAKWFLKAAEQNNADSQNYLGVMYENGEGLAKDPAQAAVWYRKSAENGNMQAQANLATLYRDGKGVAKDSGEALTWFRKAADQGDARSQNAVGLIYRTGSGVARDDTEAVKWYRMAAEKGYAAAQSNLGVVYSKGYGVERDDAQAAVWYTKAAEQNYATAQENLAELFEAGNGVPQDYVQAHKWFSLAFNRVSDQKIKDRINGKREKLLPKMTTAQIAEAERLAKAWKPK